MLTLVMDAVENYACAHTSNESGILKELFKESIVKFKLPNMSVGHPEGSFLKFLIQISKAKRVLEIGTFTGYSALAMAEALPDDGEIITLDINEQTTDLARLYWGKSPHEKKIKLVIGDATETLKNVDGLFDMIFIDADKTNYTNYWDLCVPKVKTGGFIVADNVLWKGRVLNPKDEDSIALDAFNKHVLSDKRVEVVMLTIRDVLTLTFKK